MTGHAAPHTVRFKKSRATARTFIAGCLSFCAIALFFSSTAHAQGGVPLVTVATDQSSLDLSKQFGVPAGSAINEAGDFAFVGNGGTALFFRAAGTTSATTRLLQIDDEVPGFLGSKVVSILPQIGINASRTLFFGVRLSLGDSPLNSALLTYDGTNYHTLVKSGDPAPDAGNPPYGPFLAPGSIDDAGDINFTAAPFIVTTLPGSAVGVSTLTYYILPAGAPTAKRIAGLGDPHPSCTWCVASGTSLTGSLEDFFVGNPTNSVTLIGNPLVRAIPGLNAKGQMLLSLWGGLFIGSKDTNIISPVPMGTGACSAQLVTTGTVTIPSNRIWNGLLSNSGAVVFTNSTSVGTQAICVAPANGGSTTAVITSGDPAPATIGGTITSPFALGINDSGDIIFEAANLGANVATPGIISVTPTFALLRYRQSSSQPVIDVVAYNGEAAPGTGVNGSTFSPLLGVSTGNPVNAEIPAFSEVSMAKDGRVSFRASLSSGGSAIYRQAGAFSSTNGPEFIFQDAKSVPLPGIEVINFASELPTKILNNGSVFFSAFLSAGSADFAEYLGAPGNLQTLMSTSDLLPTEARPILLGAPPVAAGHFVAFIAQPAGGRVNLLLSDVSDVTAPTITRVASDNDPALAAAGGPAGGTVLSSHFFLNENGQVAFETVGANSFLGGRGAIVFGAGVNSAWSDFTSDCGTIYLWSPIGGVQKVVAAGDSAPVASSTSAKFTCVNLNTGAPSPLNSSGAVVFSSASPFQGFCSGTFCGVPSINLALGVDGVFLYTPGTTGSISKIVAVNDTLQGEMQPTAFVPQISVPVNLGGQVAFGAQGGTSLPWTLGGTTGFQGFFVSTNGTPQKVVASGDPVPQSSDTFGFPHFISGLTNSGDLAFTAATSTATDGLFLARAGGLIQTLALDGGTAPGGSGGTFSLTPPVGQIPAPITPGGLPSITIIGLNGFNFFKNFAAMNAESDVVFGAALTGGTANSGYFRAMNNAASGALQAVVLQGQPASGSEVFDAVPVLSSDGANFALGADGAFAFVNNFSGAASTKRGLFVARPNGSLVKALATGDTVPGGGVLTGLTMGKLSAGDPGRFAFFARIRGSSAQRAIFVTALLPGTASTAITLASSQNLSVSGQAIALTATVSSAATGTPSGNIGFFDSGVSLGTQPVIAGQAILAANSLAGGSHSIVAQYDGDANFAPSTSPALPTVVTGFAPPPTGLAVTAGQTLTIPLMLYAAPNSNLTFTLSCAELPANSSCAFDQTSVTPGSSGTAIKITLSTVGHSNLVSDRLRIPSGPLRPLGLLAIASALLALGWMKVRQTPQRRIAFGTCLAALGLATVMAGCGAVGSGYSVGPGPSGTPAGPAAITVTAMSSAATVSTTVNVTVH